MITIVRKDMWKLSRRRLEIRKWELPGYDSEYRIEMSLLRIANERK
jgi:hypothetical protein